jgi:hypothetical protein
LRTAEANSPAYSRFLAARSRLNLGILILPRTAWLAVFCLLGICPFVLAKVLGSAPPVAADIVDTPPVTPNLPGDTLAKADRLPVFRPAEAKQSATLSPAEIAPVNTVQPTIPHDHPTIVARHWHEGDVLPVAKRKPNRASGRKQDTTIASSARANGR